MKIIRLLYITLFLFLSFSYSFAQNNDRSTISGFWNSFKSAVNSGDYETVRSLSRMPLQEYYYDNPDQECNDIKEYITCWEGGENAFINQINKISLPTVKQFYDETEKKSFYKRFKINYNSEVYEFTVELWHYSYAWAYIAKIDDVFYLIGDDSIEAEEG